MLDYLRFRLDIDDPAASIAVDLRHPGRPVLVAFAGVIGMMGMPVFEFFNITAGLEINRVFVRDPTCLWYQHGVPSLGADVPSAAAGIRATIEAATPSRIVTVGNSGGGYAALLFGTLMQVDEVLAFSPQTRIGAVEELRYRDSIWAGVTERLEAAGGPDPRYADLRRLLLEAPKTPRCQVHYASEEQVDALHATRLNGIPGVTVRSHAHTGHTLIVRLRDDGTLRQLLATALGIQLPSSQKRRRRVVSLRIASTVVGASVGLRARCRRLSAAAATPDA